MFYVQPADSQAITVRQKGLVSYTEDPVIVTKVINQIHGNKFVATKEENSRSSNKQLRYLAPIPYVYISAILSFYDGRIYSDVRV